MSRRARARRTALARRAWGRSGRLRLQVWVCERATRRGAVIVQRSLVLARILDDAVHDRVIVASAAEGSSRRQNRSGATSTLTADQLKRLADESGRRRSLVLLLGASGVRWDEAAALRVKEIDFLRRRIELLATWSRSAERPTWAQLKSGKGAHGRPGGVRRLLAGSHA